MSMSNAEITREFGVCMRCGAESSVRVDIISNLTTFWHGTTFGHPHPTLCRQCIEDVHRFTEQRISRADGNPVIPTQAQWELAQGEIHDLRSMLASAQGGAKNMASGLWTAAEFFEWFLPLCVTHEQRQLERFKNVSRRLRLPVSQITKLLDSQ